MVPDEEDGNIIQLELKYCERCGGLWIRRLESADVYCASCALAMMDMACSRKRKSAPRLPVNRKRDKSAAPNLMLISGRGGNA